MPWVAEIHEPTRRYCVIEHDDLVGFYFYIYEDEQTFDHLQDTLEIAKLQAFEDFQVPLDAWQEVDKPAIEWNE